MTDKISVIIITRNRAKMLSRCLSSLVSQTIIPDEVVVVDNASEDNTKKVILSFKNKLPIRYVYESRIGIPYARNKGIKVAHGSIILMLDDDCEADKFWIEKMIKAHQKYPKAWVIQGRAISKPTEKVYSLYTEFARFLYLRNYTKGKNLNIKNFFSKGFNKDIELLTCDTRNFSIKSSYLKKYNLLFDEYFYRSSDIDLGRRIVQKDGLIMFCPDIKVYHWERSTLTQFLEQRWHVGRASARLGEKWKLSSFKVFMPRLGTFITLFTYCKLLKKWHTPPILTVILLLDRLHRSIGWSYEKQSNK